MDNSLLMFASRSQQHDANLVASISRQMHRASTWAAIEANQTFQARSAILFLESPIHVLNIGRSLLAELGGSSIAHELVVTANARRHLAKQRARPNADEIRDALMKILFLGRRKRKSEMAELVCRHPGGRLLLVAIQLVGASPERHTPKWQVTTAWWMNSQKLARLQRRGDVRPIKSSAI